MMEYDLFSFVTTSNSSIYTHWYLVRRYRYGEHMGHQCGTLPDIEARSFIEKGYTLTAETS
jgi:hypothetical protein